MATARAQLGEFADDFEASCFTRDGTSEGSPRVWPRARPSLRPAARPDLHQALLADLFRRGLAIAPVAAWVLVLLLALLRVVLLRAIHSVMNDLP